MLENFYMTASFNFVIYFKTVLEQICNKRNIKFNMTPNAYDARNLFFGMDLNAFTQNPLI